MIIKVSKGAKSILLNWLQKLYHVTLVKWAAVFLLTLLALKIAWHDMIFNVFVAEEGPGAATILSIRYLKWVFILFNFYLHQKGIIE